MKVLFNLSLVLILLLPSFCMAQELNEKTLLTVDGKTVEAGEFIRMYRKSIEPGKNTDIDDYLNQFIIFKLKVADAIREGYDTTEAFKSELRGYRNQLSLDYLTDNQVIENIIKQAYTRSQTEINAWHILVAVSPDASPSDTLKAWKKVIELRGRIIKNESFDKVARAFSDDKSALSNGGNLGYFTVFQMIMSFEDAAYSLAINEISKPVRTPYGYHIIKVTDRRPSRGRVKVSHIIKYLPPDSDEAMIEKAAGEINAIYQQLQNGIPFKKLAVQYSDHKESAPNGGELGWFGTGEVMNDFAEVAFSLTDTGSYSKPFRTQYGWHIVKLLDKKSPGTYEESKTYLESRLNKSYVTSLSKKSFIEKLKKNYNFKIDIQLINWFIRNTDTLLINGFRKYDRVGMPKGNIYTFADQKISVGDFADYIEKKTNMAGTEDPSVFIRSELEANANERLLEYENSVLEKRNTDFRYLMNEFHDGILLFEISGKKEWNRVNEDTTGLRKYYDNHKTDYLTKPGINAKIYILHVPGGEEKLNSAFKKYEGKNNFDDLIIRKFNKSNDTLLVIRECRWYKGDDSEIDSIAWKKGPHQFIYKGYPAILSIDGEIDPEPMALRDVQGEMMSGYQEYLENEWVKQLMQKYSVNIDNMVLTEVKNKLSNE